MTPNLNTQTGATWLMQTVLQPTIDTSIMSKSYLKNIHCWWFSSLRKLIAPIYRCQQCVNPWSILSATPSLCNTMHVLELFDLLRLHCLRKRNDVAEQSTVAMNTWDSCEKSLCQLEGYLPSTKSGTFICTLKVETNRSSIETGSRWCALVCVLLDKFNAHRSRRRRQVIAPRLRLEKCGNK